MPALRFVVPDRQGGPSGGDVYDEQVIAAWRRGHGPVEVISLPGSWPHPAAAERHAVAAALHGGGVIVVDGLIGSACPTQIERATAAGATVVLLIHLPLPADPALEPAVAHRLAATEHRAVHAAGAVVATSNWTARDLVRRYGAVDVVVAAPGTAPAPLAAGADPPHLLVLGAVSTVKNQEILLPALASLQDLPWRATFAGPTPQPQVTARIEAAVDETGLRDRIAMPGVVRGQERERLWHHTDLLLVPSLVETYGLVVTEALARGIPAIVAHGTGAVEALFGAPGTNAHRDPPGDVAEPREAASWARVLRDWLTEPATRASWRAGALHRREHLRTWDQTAADLRHGLFTRDGAVRARRIGGVDTVARHP